MAINTNLPTPGIINEEIILSKDISTVLYCGMEVPTEFFIKVTVPQLLGFYAPGSNSAFKLLTELDANGFSIRNLTPHVTHWAHQVQSNRAEVERRRLEAAQQRERWEAMNASPEEIAKAVAERRARQADLTSRFGNKGAAFGY